MNELPKLKIVTEWDNNMDEYYYIEIENYKHQLALWDKYKDNLQDFQRDFPKLYTVYTQDFLERNTPEFVFHDWLFNKLFKEGIV